jgi:hypothetical protein
MDEDDAAFDLGLLGNEPKRTWAERAWPKLGTRWLSVWVTIHLVGPPLVALWALSVSWALFIFSLPFFIAIEIIAIGLGRRRLWAWRANWVMLALGCLINVFPKEPTRDWREFAIRSIGGLVGVVLLDAWPNYVYFRKRRALFANLQTPTSISGWAAKP